MDKKTNSLRVITFAVAKLVAFALRTKLLDISCGFHFSPLHFNSSIFLHLKIKILPFSLLLPVKLSLLFLCASFLVFFLCFFSLLLLLQLSLFQLMQYLKLTIAILLVYFLLSPFKVLKSNNYRCHNSCKNDNYMRSITDKKS